MHEAMTRLREGAAQLESGIAARRALAEGLTPREVALAWFKREMSLAAPVATEASHGEAGLSVFHLFTMTLLVVFALAMLAMYFFKMRRAAALFGRIEPDVHLAAVVSSAAEANFDLGWRVNWSATPRHSAPRSHRVDCEGCERRSAIIHSLTETSRGGAQLRDVPPNQGPACRPARR